MRSSVRCTELCYAALSRPRPARQLDAVVELCCDDVLCDKSSALPKLCTPACAQQFNAFYAACQDRIEAQVSRSPSPPPAALPPCSPRQKANGRGG